MKKVLSIAAVILVAASSLAADVYVKTKTHTDAMSMMGQTTPAVDLVTEQWFNDNQFAQISPENSFVIDIAKNMAYMIYHQSKTYVEMPLPIDIAKYLPPEAAAMAAMFRMTATVNPTTETKKVGSWNCTGYDVTISVMGFPMNMKLWATTDLPFDASAFVQKFLPSVLKGTMRLDDASVKEFAKVKGFQIASETNAEIMGAKMHTTTEVLEISKKNPPAGVYTVPAGYAKKTTIELPRR
jgi:hypothetical protein